MAIQNEIVAVAEWLLEHGNQVHYEEVRPIPDEHTRYALPITTDCSGFVTLCFAWAGAPDPNGEGFNGSGYTGTILSHCDEVIHAPELGDLVVFGPGVGHHVAIVVDPAQPVTLISHGGPLGVPPHRTNLRDEAAAQHHTEVRIVRCPGL